MTTPISIPVYVLFGNQPDEDAGGELKMLNVFSGHQEAENVLATALGTAYQNHLPQVEFGGTCSILLTRRKEDGDGSMTTGSFAIVNPGKPRQVWDFQIEKRTALPVVVKEEA